MGIHGRRTVCGLVISGALLVGWAAESRADNLAYVRASSQYEQAANRKTFHPINLLDDDPATMWCEGNSSLGEGEEIRIFFKKAQKLDRVVIGPSPKTGRRIETIRISDGSNTLRVQLGAQYVEQSFSPPMRGDKYVITILEVGAAGKSDFVPSDVACLADVMMYWRKRPFGGKMSPSEFRYDKRRDQILGYWSGEPLGAPEKFITFALDGTWEWNFEPLMGGKSQRLNGEYRFRGNRLLMRKGETGRWADVRFKHKEVKISPDDIGAPLGNSYEVISFNTVLGDDVGGDYNNAEF